MLTQTRQYGQNYNGNIIDFASFTKPKLFFWKVLAEVKYIQF